ncbi:hypothetical protein C0J52_24847 [Blattella germanica]|nr:hypothetical protein C0J52_24847 [Blattella germanica]
MLIIYFINFSSLILTDKSSESEEDEEEEIVDTTSPSPTPTPVQNETFTPLQYNEAESYDGCSIQEYEIMKIANREHLYQLAKGCSLGHMIAFDDTNKDGRLSINEFYVAFSKLYSVSVVSLDKALEVNHLSARVGDNVEIKCDVTGTPPPPIVWRRNEADLAALNEDEVRVFSDGSLYLTRIQLIHAGNYTSIPEVKVTPRIQSRRPGEEASMFCYVIGEPFPKVEWLKNDEPLKLDMPHKYEIIGNGTELKLHNIAYADTGAYMCQATNVGGMTRDISSLVVQEDPTPSK